MFKKKPTHKSNHINRNKTWIIRLVLFLTGIFLIIISYYDDINYPLDFFEHVSHTFKELIRHLGTIAIAMAVLEFIHRIAIDEEFAESIEDIKILYRMRSDVGINNFFDRMTPEIFKERLRQAHNVTLVITFIPGADAYLDEFSKSKAFENDRYEIYLLDKTNDQVQLRHSTLGNSNYGISEGINETELVLKNYNIKYKSYNVMIAFPIFIFDDIAFIGFYPYHEKAVNMPWIEVSMGGKFGEEIRKHLDSLENILKKENNDNKSNTN